MIHQEYSAPPWSSELCSHYCSTSSVCYYGFELFHLYSLWMPMKALSTSILFSSKPWIVLARGSSSILELVMFIYNSLKLFSCRFQQSVRHHHLVTSHNKPSSNSFAGKVNMLKITIVHLQSTPQVPCVFLTNTRMFILVQGDLHLET